MNLEKKLSDSLQEKGKEATPPLKLKHKVMNKIQTSQRVSMLKKRLIAGFIAVCLIIPTSAFAYQVYLADDIYGSFENIKKHISSATMEGYMIFNAKLLQAKGELGKEDYDQFREQLKVLTNSKVEYGDQYGNIDYDLVPHEIVTDIKNAMMEIQPFFDKLNDQESSIEVLSAEEYELYIEALMTYEKILVQSRINPSNGVDTNEIQPELLKEFITAKGIMKDVNERIKSD